MNVARDVARDAGIDGIPIAAAKQDPDPNVASAFASMILREIEDGADRLGIEGGADRLGIGMQLMLGPAVPEDARDLQIGVEQRVEVESDASPQWFILRVSDSMSGVYQVDVKGIDGGGFFGFDPMTYLYSFQNDSLELMDRDDDSGDGFDSRLDDVVLDEGSYYIAVIEITGSSGSFSIEID